MRFILIPLIALDVLCNVLLSVVGAVLTFDPSMVIGSWNTTLSARAGHMAAKHQPYFWWVAGVIDFFFGQGHCAAQYRREAMYGSVWSALSAT